MLMLMDNQSGWPSLTGQHVLVTGGGGGLGSAMAIRCAAAGARITINGRTEETLHKVVEDIRAAGGEGHYIVCDVRDPNDVEECVHAAEEVFGNLTALVNNAAANFLSRSEALSPNAFDTVIRTNLYGSFYATQAVGRRWIKRRSGGTVLSIITTYTQTGSGFVMPSAASKAGVEAMTKSLAVEWGSYGIRLNAIAPGAFPTEGAWKRLVAEETMEKAILRRIPLGRFGRAEELASLAAFLISPEAGFMNGSVVRLDGGEVLSAGGQFNDLTRLPGASVDEMLQNLRAQT